MAKDFNRNEFIKDMEAAGKLVIEAEELGQALTPMKFERIFFVACGASNRAMLVWEYWLKMFSTKIEVRRYFPAEFVQQDPAAVNEKTLVILASHSGTTKETVSAAEFLKNKPCTTVGITQKGDSPLSQAVQNALNYGSKRGYYAFTMLFSALVSAIFQATGEWEFHEKLMRSLKGLPSALADSIEINETRVTEDARTYKDDRIMYVVGSGPMFSTTYVLAVCTLMEMQWMHVQPLEAAEFFHGSFEVVDHTTPLILLVGEDPSRPLAERVVRFCKKYTERLMIYDSREFAMDGIDKELRSLFAPFILDAALLRLANHLAVWHNHPLSTRRYMWKTEY